MGRSIAVIFVSLLWGGLAAGIGLMIRCAIWGDEDIWECRDHGDRLWWMVMIGLGDPARYHGGWIIMGIKLVVIGTALMAFWKIAVA